MIQRHTTTSVSLTKQLETWTRPLTAYQRAAELEPDNKYYRLNYRRCRIHLRRSGVDDEDALHTEAEPALTEQ